MKSIDKSIELRKNRDNAAIQIRNLKNEIEDRRRNLAGLSPDSAAYFSIQDEIREREGAMYALRREKAARERELYRALTDEEKALSTLDEKMTGELRPKIDAILSEAENAMADFAARLEALAGEYPGRPEHFGLIMNIDLRRENRKYAARERALEALMQPLRFVRYQKSTEADNLFNNNGRPKDWRE